MRNRTERTGCSQDQFRKIYFSNGSAWESEPLSSPVPPGPKFPAVKWSKIWQTTTVFRYFQFELVQANIRSDRFLRKSRCISGYHSPHDPPRPMSHFYRSWSFDNNPSSVSVQPGEEYAQQSLYHVLRGYVIHMEAKSQADVKVLSAERQLQTIVITTPWLLRFPLRQIIYFLVSDSKFYFDNAKRYSARRNDLPSYWVTTKFQT